MLQEGPGGAGLADPSHSACEEMGDVMEPYRTVFPNLSLTSLKTLPVQIIFIPDTGGSLFY